MTRLIALIVSSLLLAGLFSPALAQSFDPTAPDAVVEYGGPEPLVIDLGEGETTAFTIELANAPESRQRGMMHRETMADDFGMLFDFENERIVTIWMENTIVSLDIVYIRSDGTIAKIITGAVPFSRRQLHSDVPVLAVLEIKAGQAAARGIQPGDVVRHAMFGTAEAEVVAEDVSDPVEDEAPAGDSEEG